ncbi:MAG: hydrogenase maturation protein [Rubrivivax sp.]|nr:hydrogenase maturation protein [Rubrivivax sp.]
MRILFLTRSFNGLAQRLFLELTERGHEVSIEFDIADSVTEEAAALWQPALVVAPFLTRAIPASVWQAVPCFVVHPGIVGDRGPSSLDWAITEGEATWGVTVLQAVAEMDAGPVWAHESFTMRAAPKSSLYRREVTEAAVRAVLAAVARFERGEGPPPATTPDPRGRLRPLMKAEQRRIDWARMGMAEVLRHLHAADGSPGVPDELFGTPCRLYDGHEQPLATRHEPGRVIARHEGALLRATHDGGVWIGHVRRSDIDKPLKLPAVQVFSGQAAALPAWPLPGEAPEPACRDLWHEAVGDVRVLHFPFHNGAMSTRQCERLNAALQDALAQPQRVLLLTGGPEFWSNGIHLHAIESAASAADESWRNINAIDDVTRTLIEASDKLVIALMRGNAGAGGVFMALAADFVWARRGVVMNPHYKNMGNLYGSEYWTYLLPRRLQGASADTVMGRRLPMAAAAAQAAGLVDELLEGDPDACLLAALQKAQQLAAGPQLAPWLQAKRQRREADEARRPLAAYRADELARMRRNFFGFDPSYHIARSNFVHRVPHSWTPRHLARHRDR